MTLRKIKDAGNRKRKHYITLCGELAWEEALDVSYDRLQNKLNQKTVDQGSKTRGQSTVLFNKL
jgi:hypothetical protein